MKNANEWGFVLVPSLFFFELLLLLVLFVFTGSESEPM